MSAEFFCYGCNRPRPKDTQVKRPGNKKSACTVYLPLMIARSKLGGTTDSRKKALRTETDRKVLAK